MITTVTMNAALDKAYYMDNEIVNGTVMRVPRCHTSAGGKGLNVARVVHLCGAGVLATGLVGGFNGHQLESLLDQDGILHRFSYMKGETRCCINILDPGYGSTEYLEPGCEVSEEETEQFMNLFPKVIRDSAVITISGSLPRGLDKGFYERLITIAKASGKMVILDTSGEMLEKGIKACPTMVKPNKDEIEQLFGVEIQGFHDMVWYAQKIHDKGIPYVVVSLGKDGAVLVCGAGIYHGKPPIVEAVNTVGCGDSMVGAFATAFERKDTAVDALKYAVAVATANAMSPNTGEFDPKICRELLEQIDVEKL